MFNSIMKIFSQARGAVVNVTVLTDPIERSVNFASMLAATFQRWRSKVPQLLTSWMPFSTQNYLTSSTPLTKNSSTDFLCIGTFVGREVEWDIKPLVGEIPTDSDKLIHLKEVMVITYVGKRKRITWSIGGKVAIISESYE